MATVLVVDDNARIVSILSACLTADGYEVLTARDGTSAISLAQSGEPDIALVDVMLPDIDGLQLTRVFREQGIPTIIVSARVTEDDRVAGLEIGADDYITKPFSTREVLARVRIALRHSERERSAQGQSGLGEEIRVGGFVVDLRGRVASYDGVVLQLTRTEFELLRLLAEKPGEVLSREELSAALHGHSDTRGDRAIDTHMKNLRRALGSPAKELIVSVYGFGYRLEA